MPIPLTWESGLALFAIDLLRSDQIEALATLGLQRDFDSHLMRELAGGFAPQDRDPRAAFANALAELGLRLPSRPEAARHLAKAFASEVITNHLDPLRAANFLADVSRAVGAEFHELDPFTYADSEASARPADRDLFAQAIKQEASRWLETGRGSV